MNKPDSFQINPKLINDFGQKILDVIVHGYTNSNIGLYPEVISEKKLTDILGSKFTNESLEANYLVEKFVKSVQPYLFNSSTKYNLQLMASPLPIPALFNTIVNFFNIQPYGQINAQIGKMVIKEIGKMVGFSDESKGIITSGGTISNLYALVVARVNKANYDFRKKGFKNQMTAYTSDECHASIKKAAELIGLGSENLRIIETDNDFRIDENKLRFQIKADLENGLQPFCIIGNLGSARTGSIDNIKELSNIAREFDLWLHVDGAYGAFGYMDDSKKSFYKGLKQADSMTVDPHKWLNVPLESSCLLVNKSSHLSDAFNLVDDYLGFDVMHPDNPVTQNYELSKSDGGLKLWFTLNTYGLDNFKKLITYHNYIIGRFAQMISSNKNFELLKQPDLSICCFRFIWEDIKNDRQSYNIIVNNVNKAISIVMKSKESILVSTTKINGIIYLRICVINHRIDSEVLDLIIDKVEFWGVKIKNKYMK